MKTLSDLDYTQNRANRTDDADVNDDGHTAARAKQPLVKLLEPSATPAELLTINLPTFPMAAWHDAASLLKLGLEDFDEDDNVQFVNDANPSMPSSSGRRRRRNTTTATAPPTKQPAELKLENKSR